MDDIGWSVQGQRVLITGGSGFIGQHVLAEGLQLGAEMHAIALPGEMAPGATIHATTLTDRARVFEIVQQVQPAAVIHLAAAGVTGGTHALDTLLHVNGTGTDNLLAALIAASLRPRIILAGSGYEYGASTEPIPESAPLAPASPYGVSKAAATLCAGMYSNTLAITVLRFFNVYGPGEPAQRLVPYIINCALQGRIADVTPCEQIRDFVYVPDLAQLVWQVLRQMPDAPGLGVYNVGSGQPIVLKDFVGLVIAELKRRGFEATLAFGARPYRAGEPMVYVADTRRLVQDFGWRPPTSLEAGVRHVVEAAL
jgi:UDP-glucose 4-epimerase